jgi:hypothetical protein
MYFGVKGNFKYQVIDLVCCTFPETSKIKCPTSLRLHPITGKQARARLHDFDPAPCIF